MHKFVWAALGALALAGWVFPVKAQQVDNAQATGPELAFMPSTRTVTLLNEGGKYVLVDLRHIPQGGTCRMDKDAIIMRVGARGTRRKSRDNTYTLCCSSDELRRMPVYDDVRYDQYRLRGWSCSFRQDGR